MGPAAWAAVGRALGVALASSLFKGEGSIVVLLAKQLERAIAQRKLELATALLRDLAYRHRRAFDEFMAKFGSDLPPDVKEELEQL